MRGARLLDGPVYVQPLEDLLLAHHAGVQARVAALTKRIALVHIPRPGYAPPAERLAGRIGVLARAMESAPKSLAWRLRARVGERMTWYEMPEELD